MRRRTRRGAVALRLAVGLWLAAGALAPRSGWAYAWMIRHDYTGCNQCHADPSGGSLLTLYGRAQGEVLLRSRYDAGDEEPGKVANFAFGAFELPENVLLGGDIRGLYLSVRPDGAPPVNQSIFMQSDVQGQVAFDRLRVNASVGYARQGALPAAITHDTGDNLVSRTHWVGVDLGEDKQWLLRAGRMNLPFGVRAVEHNFWVRARTRTDINDQQQHGLALAYNGEQWRGEAMAIVGNFQMSPSIYREHGYSAYVETAPNNHLAVGASSLITNAERDVQLQTGLWRQAHGLFARAAPVRAVVFMAETDLLVLSQPPNYKALGFVGLLQADIEPWQGIHLIGAAELLREAQAQGSMPATSYDAWESVAWFFAPHADVRLDAIEQTNRSGSTSSGTTTLLAQLHLFL